MATKVKTGVLGTLTELNFADNSKARFGAGNDLQISHVSSGSYNYIQSYTSGELVIESNGNTKIRTNNADDMAKFLKNGAVELYYDNDLTFQTTTSGVQIGRNNDTTVRLQLYGATSADHEIFFGNDGTNGHKDGAIRYFGEAHSTTANRRAMTFSTSQTEKMRIDSSGVVGIGTNSAAIASGSAGLVIHSTTGGTGSTGASRLRFTNTTTGQASTDGVELSLDGNTNNFYIENRESTGSTIFYQGAERMRIHSSGKVLIGDSASHVDDLLQIETPASGGGHGIQIRRNDSNGDQGIGRIMFGNNNDTDLATISSVTDGQADCARLVFSTQPTSGNSTERMRIDSNGRVTKPSQPYFSVTPSSDQSISVTTWTDIAWGTETTDTGGNFASNTFTAPVAGVYLFTGVIGLNTIAATNYLLVRMECSTAGSHYITHEQKRSGGGDYGYDHAISQMITLAASETVKIQIFAGGGGTHQVGSRSLWQGILLA